MSWMKEIAEVRKTRASEIKRLLSRRYYTYDQIVEIIRICGWNCTIDDVKRTDMRTSQPHVLEVMAT